MLFLGDFGLARLRLGDLEATFGSEGRFGGIVLRLFPEEANTNGLSNFPLPRFGVFGLEVSKTTVGWSLFQNFCKL